MAKKRKTKKAPHRKTKRRKRTGVFHIGDHRPRYDSLDIMDPSNAVSPLNPMNPSNPMNPFYQ